METQHPVFRRFLKAMFGKKGGEVALLLIFLPLLYLFAWRGMRFFLVPSTSMEPTLLKHDYILTLKEPTYVPGDIVVLKDPEEEGAYLVKRLIATGGETVTVSEGAVYIDGEYLSEPYVLSPPEYALEPFRVPEGHVFLLGDNRNNSDDSHSWSKKSLPVDQIVGKVRYVYCPYTRAGRVEGYPIRRFPGSPSKSGP